jgi:hypothetical protein
LPVEDQPDGPLFFAVLHQKDDRLGEVRVLETAPRYQQFSWRQLHRRLIGLGGNQPAPMNRRCRRGHKRHNHQTQHKPSGNRLG